MGSIPPIRVEVVADTSGLKTGLAQAEQGIKKMDDSVKTASTGMANFTNTLKKVGAAMGVAFAGAQLAKFAKESIMAASDMAESVSKVQVVFAGTSEAVLAFGKTAADNLGISSQAALEATGTYGNLFQALGVGKDKAQDMSINMVKLAADLSSFNNMPITDSLNALRSGLSGETEPLKRFGIALNDVTLRNKAMTMGFGEIKGVMDPAIKSQVTYALVMEQTKLAQGDYARTADGAANTMKSLTAKFEDAKVAIGNALMPAFRALLALLKLLIPIIEGLGKYFTENATALKMYAIIIGTAVIAFYSYRAAIIATKVTQQAFIIIQTLMKGATLASIASTNGLAASMLVLNAAMRANPIGLIVTALMLVGAAFVLAWKKSETFRGIVIKVVQVVMDGFAKLVDVAAKFFNLLGKVPGMGWAKDIGKSLDGISDKIKSTSKNLSDLKSGFGGMGNVSMTAGSAGVTGGSTSTTPTTTAPSAAALAKAKEDAKKRLEVLAKHAKDVKEIYKDMNKVIADANEDAEDALAKRNERMADIIADYNETVENLQDRYKEQMGNADKRYLESTANAYERNAEVKIDIEKNYQERLTQASERLAEQILDIKQNAADNEKALIQKFNEKVADLREKAAEKSLNLQTSYDEKITGLKNAAVEKLLNLEEKYNDKVKGLKEGAASKAIELEKAYTSKIAEVRNAANEKATSMIRAATEKQAAIVQQGVDRLRNAFASGVGTVNLADAFKGDGGGTDKLLSDLRAKLQGAKDLQANAAALAGMGYSQIFIEEVVKNGPEAGNAIASALKSASPEATAELQSLYGSLEATSKHGLDALAAQMSTSTNFATEELLHSYQQVSVDLQASLVELNNNVKINLSDLALSHTEVMGKLATDLSAALLATTAEYQKSVSDVNNALNASVAEAKATLDKNLAEVQKALIKDLADAQAELDKSIIENNAKMVEALAAVQVAYEKSIAEAKKIREEQLLDAEKELLKSLAAATKALKEAQTEAQENLDKGLADAQKALQKALLDAQKDYEKAIDEINKSTMKKLADLKAKLAEVAAAMAALGAAQAAAAAMASAPVYTPIVAIPSASGSSASNSSNSTTVNITGVNLTDPYNTTTSVVNAIKFGNVVVPVAPTNGESGQLGAANMAANTYTLNGNTSSGRVGR